MERLSTFATGLGQFKFDDEVAKDPFIKPNQKLIVHIIFRLNL